jgi:hypothetical protein
MPMTTTLNEIRKYRPCEYGWKKLLKGLGKTEADDDPLLFSEILRINDFDDALWCLRAASREYDNKIRLFAVSVARRVQHLMQDKRSIDALDVTERYAKGEITKEELSSAEEAARGAAKAAASSSDAVRAAAWASASTAASSAAWLASAAAAKAAVAVWAEAGEAAAGEAERKWQKEQFLKLVNEE